MREKISTKNVTILLTLAFFTIVFLSCNKDPHNEPPATTLTKKELLVKYKWKTDEVLRNIDGTNSHYRREVINNTGVNYDTLQITFNSDGTGMYQDELGVVHPTTWQFTASDFRDLTLVIGAPGSQTFLWNLVEITPEALHNTTAVGEGILVSARFLPVPRDTPDK
ncbi:MAG: hypothetical protein ABI416_12140 [Ginsengibacter sp.]